MFSLLSNFKHKQEMRESKDEILVGEIVRAMARLNCPAIGFIANSDFQAMRFKPVGDKVLNSIIIQLDRKTGDSMLQAALLGSQATLMVQAEVKNYLADPDDLVKMYRTDLANIFKIPMLGDVRLDHQLNSVLGTKKVLINIDNYILKGDESANNLMNLIRGIVNELHGKLAPYKKA
jgi:hypothetical protein